MFTLIFLAAWAAGLLDIDGISILIVFCTDEVAWKSDEAPLLDVTMGIEPEEPENANIVLNPDSWLRISYVKGLKSMRWCDN